ncbi:hypothetical protein BpHYR1_022767 [Brachionus plicatilis]|uniref:Uncharacterized protein n=1 Tax=Brachionus plicatilis TaxID=10195 RepID=A0A3M7Q7I2_BRAPC|nr:hypothetical protein BpHYR1_022767 [Brachionus plicatilis]
MTQSSRHSVPGRLDYDFFAFLFLLFKLMKQNQVAIFLGFVKYILIHSFKFIQTRVVQKSQKQSKYADI